MASLGWVRDEPDTWHCNERMRTMALAQPIRLWPYARVGLLIIPARPAAQRDHSTIQRVYAHLNRRFRSPRSADASPVDYDVTRRQQRCQSTLLASFNSINVFRPHGLHADWKTTAEPWYHVDSDSRPERTRPHGGLVFPGVVNLYEVSAATGGFVAGCPSHMRHISRAARRCPRAAAAATSTCART